MRLLAAVNDVILYYTRNEDHMMNDFITRLEAAYEEELDRVIEHCIDHVETLVRRDPAIADDIMALSSRAVYRDGVEHARLIVEPQYED